MDDELYHYGVKGMKWGSRKAIKIEYKNKKKKALQEYKSTLKKNKNSSTQRQDAAKNKYKSAVAKAKATYKQKKEKLKIKDIDEQIKKYGKEKVKADNNKKMRRIIVGGTVAGIALKTLSTMTVGVLRATQLISNPVATAINVGTYATIGGAAVGAIGRVHSLSKKDKIIRDYDSRHKKTRKTKGENQNG